MTSVDAIADDYVERAAALDPCLATRAGIAGHDDELPDLSGDGFGRRAGLARSTLAALAAEARGPREQVARAAMRERLGRELECYEAGDTTSQLNVIASWVRYVRQVFDLMPTDGEQAAVNIARRMAAVPAAYDQLSTTLLRAANQGRSPARRQVEEVAKQCAAWTEPGNSFYSGLVERLTGVPGSLRGDLEKTAEQAAAATARLGVFLTSELLPLARPQDACGPEVYSRALGYFLGAAADPEAAYAAGWEQIERLRSQQQHIASQVRRGVTPRQAAAILDRDPARHVEGQENFLAWMQDLADRTIGELHGVHFDIPEQARRIEAVIAPTSEGGIYYADPSEDWSRPGRIWWPVPPGLTSFPTWKEVTNIHHEGAPGHHLQISQQKAEGQNLNRWQRQLCWVDGHGEGWACYAEQLMAELGYLDDPGAHLGMLDRQLLYAAILVLDIGLHLELQIPEDSAWRQGRGERWNADLALAFLQAHSRLDKERLRFALHRSLGWPGQAPSYALGREFWLRARAEAMERAGDAFSLKEFHSQALSLGSMGLDPLREALANMTGEIAHATSNGVQPQDG
jgi:uncharacterized protein (DUF885 family)